MVTRFRIEATGRTEAEVSDRLAKAAKRFCEEFGGLWFADDGDAQIQTTKDGWWGSLTMRRREAV